MKKVLLSFFAFALMANLTSAQSLVGIWKTIDDTDGEANSYVKIFKSKDGKYYGNVSKIMDPKEQDDVCDKCADDDYRKDKKILGMQILKGLSFEKGTKYSGGKILDPDNGKDYKTYVELISNDKLKVRGYIGIEALGRTQYWYRVK